MPKHESLTPKAIANRIKAKGLQKLRWYCQMCQKQCRDENGFKCHTMSESHQRQLLLFAENPDKYIDHFSQDFLDSFMELLKRRFGTKRVHANQVYQEYIADRNHLHMNSTQWETLTEFVKWLGKESYCVVDQTEKGWFISYIDRDPETIQKQEALAKKEKMDMDDEERMAKFVEKQIERGREEGKLSNEKIFTELKKQTDDEKVAFSLRAALKKDKSLVPPESNPLNETNSLRKTFEQQPVKRKMKTDSEAGEKKQKSALAEIMQEQEMMKEKKNRKDYWLTTQDNKKEKKTTYLILWGTICSMQKCHNPWGKIYLRRYQHASVEVFSYTNCGASHDKGIVVKIIAQQLGVKYYKKKAVVTEVKDKYMSIVKVIETGDKLKLDQVHLETVIPAVGRKLMVVNGAYRGSEAVLLEVMPEQFCVKIQINSGALRGRIVDKVKYEDICKIYAQS